MTARPYDVAAYYFPGFHADPVTDVRHGTGWSEWDLMEVARPRFPGHRQPIVSAWGSFDEADPAWAARQVDLAVAHGLTCFIYDWYWYDGAPFLNGALDRGFLGADNNTDLKFALMWANHDWYDLQPTAAHGDLRVLASGRVSERDWDAITEHVISAYFARPNYLTIGGDPYFSLYDIAAFIASFDGVDGARRALDRFRTKAAAAGHDDVHLNVVTWGLHLLPSETTQTDVGALIDAFGIRSFGRYTWWHAFGSRSFPTCEYADAAARNLVVSAEDRDKFPIPVHANVTMGFDATPRTVQSDRYEPRPVYGYQPVCQGNTPEAFEQALREVRDFVDAGPTAGQLFTINAWNEWTEGSYLLPDTEHGMAYLEALRRVFPPPPGP